MALISWEVFRFGSALMGRVSADAAQRLPRRWTPRRSPTGVCDRVVCGGFRLINSIDYRAGEGLEFERVEVGCCGRL